MMAQAIGTVLILLIVVVYAVLFAVWNPGMLEVVGWNFWPQKAWAEVPAFVLPLAGVVIGAIVMAIAVSAPWSSLKARLASCEDQLKVERSRSKERARKIEALQSRLQQVAAQTHPTPEAAGEAEPEEPPVSEEEA